MRLHLALAAFAALAPASALAGDRVPVKAVTASSTYTEEGNYEAKRVIDGKQGTAWVEGDEGSGLGASLELDLGGTHKVEAIKVWAGDWYSSTYWERANRPKELEFKFSDGSTETHTLKDAFEPQLLKLATPRDTSSVRVRLKSVYGGSAWLDTGISEIQVFGADHDDGRHAFTATASSEADADADGNYKPGNVGDGIEDAMWCEGDKDGDGTGAWLQLDLGAPRKVGRIGLINGIGTSLSLWMKGNRATAAMLTFDDGATAPLEIKSSMRPQELTFGPVTTRTVRITFTGVTKGSEYNDLCISELWLGE
jgi:hypothetical protein